MYIGNFYITFQFVNVSCFKIFFTDVIPCVLVKMAEKSCLIKHPDSTAPVMIL